MSNNFREISFDSDPSSKRQPIAPPLFERLKSTDKRFFGLPPPTPVLLQPPKTLEASSSRLSHILEEIKFIELAAEKVGMMVKDIARALMAKAEILV